jgi:hypothetical protein
MRPRRIEQMLWLATSIAATGGPLAMRAQWAPRPSSSVAAAIRPRTQNQESPPRQKTIPLSDVSAADLFRRGRSAPDMTMKPGTTLTPQSKPPGPPRPRLLLRGIVGGPPWDAIVEGFPNHEGSYVVRAGDSLAGLKVRSVRGDAVMIRGMDTTWILKLARVP